MKTEYIFIYSLHPLYDLVSTQLLLNCHVIWITFPNLTISAFILLNMPRSFSSAAHSMDMGLGGLWELVMDREAWRAAVHGVKESRTWLSDWTELTGNRQGRRSTSISEVLRFVTSDQVAAFLPAPLFPGKCLVPASLGKILEYRGVIALLTLALSGYIIILFTHETKWKWLCKHIVCH